MGALIYESFFGLRERPFDLTPNPRFLVLTEAHREALSNLEYGIASRRGITVLIGDAGTGKTTLIQTALQRLPQQVHCVHLHNPALTRDEFIEMLAMRFALSARAHTSKAALLNELETILRERDRRQESSVLIVDEAQTLPLDLLEEVRLLGNIETGETKLLSIVMAGQPELAKRLNEEAFRQLKQRVALRCELRPLTQAETAGYLAGRIRAAGGVGAQVFTREAVMMIHDRSRGIPRTVSVIADNALLTAFAIGQKPINRQTIGDVCRDLDLPTTGGESLHPPYVPPPVTRHPVDRTVADPLEDPPLHTRVLSFDGGADPAGDTAGPGGEAANKNAAEPAPVGNGVFGKAAPKRRRRFPFFRTTVSE